MSNVTMEQVQRMLDEREATRELNGQRETYVAKHLGELAGVKATDLLGPDPKNWDVEAAQIRERFHRFAKQGEADQPAVQPNAPSATEETTPVDKSKFAGLTDAQAAFAASLRMPE
jgi:hypothetical protein